MFQQIDGQDRLGAISPGGGNSSRVGAGVQNGLRSADHSMISDESWNAVRDVLRLSDREFQIVQGVFDDATEQQIARRHRMSPHTVHTHLQRLYRKLHVTSRTQLTLRVFAEFLVIRDVA